MRAKIVCFGWHRANPCGQPAHKRAATNRRRHTCALADRRESGIYCAGAHAARAPL